MGKIHEAVDAAFNDFVLTDDLWKLLVDLTVYADKNIRSENNLGIFLGRLDHWKQKLRLTICIKPA